MLLDLQVLEEFYASNLGKEFINLARPYISSKINIRNKSIVKLGYLDPFLDEEITTHNKVQGIIPNNYFTDGNRPLPNSYLTNQDINHLPFNTASIDLFLTINVIEYSQDIDLTLREIWRCLDNHGRLIIITPLIYNIHSLLNDTPLKLAQRFTENSLSTCLTRNNFSILSSQIMHLPIKTENELLTYIFNKYLLKLSSILVIDAAKNTVILKIEEKNYQKSQKVSIQEN